MLARLAHSTTQFYFLLCPFFFLGFFCYPTQSKSSPLDDARKLSNAIACNPNPGISGPSAGVPETLPEAEHRYGSCLSIGWRKQRRNRAATLRCGEERRVSSFFLFSLAGPCFFPTPASKYVAALRAGSIALAKSPEIMHRQCSQPLPQIPPSATHGLACHPYAR